MISPPNIIYDYIVSVHSGMFVPPYNMLIQILLNIQFLAEKL